MSDSESKPVVVPSPSASTIGNPAPLGLCAFALTTFVLSCHNAGIVTAPNIVVGLALFYGGIAQLLAGMWEFKACNTFGATAFSSYGAFWLSLGVIFIPGFGIPAAYATAGDLDNALAIYLLSWTIFTGIMLIASHRTTGGLVALFFFLFVTFLLLTAGAFGASKTANVAGGAFGIITAFIAWYNALSGLLTPETSHFTLPVVPLKRK